MMQVEYFVLKILRLILILYTFVSTVINTSGCDTTPVVGLVNKWPNMDVVEHEKLQWMEELPPPKPPPLDVPYNARFSFDGKTSQYYI